MKFNFTFYNLRIMKKLILLFGIAIFIDSCGKKTVETTNWIQDNNIYLAGESATNASPSNTWATIWHQQSKTLLGDDAVQNVAKCKSVIVRFNNTYAVGTTVVNGVRKAAYWVNDVLYLLPNSGEFSEAIDIAVKADSTIVICGYEFRNNKQFGIVWENLQATYLQDANIFSRANAITTSGNDVYICGVSLDPSNPTIERAVFWKNGVAEFLEHSGKFSEAMDIAIMDGSIFIVGKNTSDMYPTACAWVNGSRDALLLNSNTNNTSAKAICLSKDANNEITTHIVGGEYPENNFDIHRAIYWKNRQQVTLPNSQDATSEDVKVATNGDVFIVGKYYFTPYSFCAAYWKNQTLVRAANAAPTAIDAAWGIDILP
jgi:hypothetical protein